MKNTTFSTKLTGIFNRGFKYIVAELKQLRELPLFGLFLYCLALAALISLTLTILFSILPFALLLFAGLLGYKIISQWFSSENDTDPLAASATGDMQTARQSVTKLLK